jgi:hypothetical protein
MNVRALLGLTPAPTRPGAGLGQMGQLHHCFGQSHKILRGCGPAWKVSLNLVRGFESNRPSINLSLGCVTQQPKNQRPQFVIANVVR